MPNLNVDNSTIFYHRGNHRVITITVVDRNGAAQNITSSTATLTIKKTFYTDTAEFQLTVGSGLVITDGSGGVYTATITNTNTTSMIDGDYVYGLTITLTGGEIGTPITGTFKMLPEI